MDYDDALEFRTRNGMFRIVQLDLGNIPFEEKQKIIPDFGISIFEGNDYRVKDFTVDQEAKIVWFELEVKNTHGDYIKIINYLFNKTK